ncbi:MAG: ATP-binding protein, partial [Ignavibacteriae bacterium]|nr:ATP-binding protein [Ignavibacteriota bacterium]
MELNRLEKRLKEINSDLFSRLQNAIKEVNLLLNEYSKNFPEYTDHSIEHTKLVFDYASLLLSDEDIDNLNDDEIYVLSMACYLHDVGMCIPEDKIQEIGNTEEILEYRKNNPDKPVSDYIRDIHHILSYKFIEAEQELLGIPNDSYAKAIGLVAQGHRKVDLENIDIYKPRFTVKSGRTFVCLPYLAAIIRIADELDITNVRTPRLLTKYYMPDNEFSKREWHKHISTTKVNLLEDDDTIRYEVVCTTQDMYAALQEQFEKVNDALLYSLKVIRNISDTGRRSFSLDFNKIDVEYYFKGFDPKGIKFSFDVNNVVKTFIGENLYDNKLVAIREALQNAIDTCRYKKVLKESGYEPKVTIEILEDKIVIEDNGLGMDEFIVKNYFSKMASSFYQQANVAKEYEAIGQFGIGVFSYFLIADYVDIETKTDKSKPLKFRIDKDPNNYFHFFEKSTKIKSGTSITFYLKKEIEIDIDEIYTYIRDTFRYIEFPLTFVSGEDNKSIEKLSFQIDVDSMIKEACKPQGFENISKIKYHVFNFNKNNYEGVYIHFYLDNLCTIKYTNNLIYNQDLFDGEYSSNVIRFSQKGVFVKNDRNLLSDNSSILLINLKHKVGINLDRSSFSSSNELQRIVVEIQKEYTEDFFKKIVSKCYEKRLPEVSANYFRGNYYGSKDFLFLNIIIGRDKITISLADLLRKKPDSFIIVSDEKLILEDFETIILYPNNFDRDFLDYTEIIESRSDDYFFKYDVVEDSIVAKAFSNREKKKVVEDREVKLSKVYEFYADVRYFCDKNIFLINVIENERAQHFINLNHNFIAQICEIDNEKLTPYLKRRIKDILSKARFNKKDLKSINFLIKHIEKESGIKYS